MADRTELVDGLRVALKKLESQDFSLRTGYQSILHDAEDLLFAFFEFGSSGSTLTQEEKVEFAPLIQQALLAIGFRVSYVVGVFPSAGLESSYIERSGLQYIFDHFKGLPMAGITQDLKNFEKEESIDVWDGCLQEYSDDPGFTVTEDFKSKLPRSHYWWFSWQ